jgi:hypothetical protein
LQKHFSTTVSFSDAFFALLFRIVFQNGVEAAVGVEEGNNLMLGIQQTLNPYIMAIHVPCSMFTINGTWRNSELGIEVDDGI